MTIPQIGKKKIYFYRYCLHVFSTEEILKRHIKVCFKINGNKRIAMSKEDEYVKFKNYERKIKSLFIIHAHFERNLVPENSRKEKPEQSYTNKYQNTFACSYCYKLVCINDKFSKLFKTYSSKNVV